MISSNYEIISNSDQSISENQTPEKSIMNQKLRVIKIGRKFGVKWDIFMV